MKTTIGNASLPSVDEILCRFVMARPEWEPLGRSLNQVDCYGFAHAVYGEGLGLPIADFDQETKDLSTIANWFRRQREEWVELDEPESYCLVALGKGKHVTHVGIYHPEGLVYHVTHVGVVGQPASELYAYGYSLVKYYQHRSLICDPDR